MNINIKRGKVFIILVILILVLGVGFFNKQFSKQELSEISGMAFGYDTSFPLLGPDSPGECDANCQCKKKCDKKYGEDSNYDDLDVSPECKQSLEDKKENLKNKCKARCDSDSDDDKGDCEDDCADSNAECLANCPESPPWYAIFSTDPAAECKARCGCREDNCNDRCEKENDGEGEDDDESENSCIDENRDEEEEIADCAETTECSEEECEQVVNDGGDGDGDGDGECNENNEGELCSGEVDDEGNEVCAVCIGGKCTSNSAPHESDEFSENDDSFLRTIPEYELKTTREMEGDGESWEVRHIYLDYTSGMLIDSDYISDSYPLEEGCTCEDECREKYANCIGDDTDSEGNSCSENQEGQLEEDCFALKTECLLECDTPEREETSFENLDCTLATAAGIYWTWDGQEWDIAVEQHDPLRILSETEEESCENIRWNHFGEQSTYSIDELPVIYYSGIIVRDDGNVEGRCIGENTKAAAELIASIMCPLELDDYFKGFIDVTLDLSTNLKHCSRDATIMENGQYLRKTVLCLGDSPSYCESKHVCSESYGGEGQAYGGYVPCVIDSDCAELGLGTCTENLGECKPKWLGLNDKDDLFPGNPDAQIRVDLDFGDISYSPDLPADERGIIGYEFKITLGAKAYKTESGGEEIFYEALTPLRSITKNSLRTFGQALEELKSDEEINNLLNELVPERWSIAYRDQYSWVTDEIIIKVDNAEETVEVSEKIIIDPHGFPGSDILALDDGPFIDNSPGWVTKILMNGELSLMLTLLLSNLEKKISPAIQQYNQDSEPIIEIYGDAGGPQVESKIKLILAANDPAKDFTKLAKYIIFKTWECTE